MNCTTIDDVVAEISCRIKPNCGPIPLAKAVFDWEVQNIQYDHERLRNHFRTEILPPEETLQRGQGICTDMSALYVAITRRLGLESYYANVEIDHKNEHVNHACAVVKVPHELQVDPAYKIFNAKHRLLHIVEPEAQYCPPRFHRHESFNEKLTATAIGIAALLGLAIASTYDEQQNTKYQETIEVTQELKIQKIYKYQRTISNP